MGTSYPSMDRLEKIAAALSCELRDLFEFSHQTKEPKKEIIALLNQADPEKLRLIYKILRAIVR